MTAIRVSASISPAAMGFLSRAPVELRDSIAKKALQAGAKITLDDMRGRTPVGDPADKPLLKPLRDTEGTVTRSYGSAVVVVLGPEYPAGAHGHLVEAGTAPHEITTDKRTLMSRQGGAQFGRLSGVPLGKIVQHPGAKPNPFMQPAIDATAAASEAAVMNTIGAELDKLAKVAA